MVIRTDVENLPCEYTLGIFNCVHPRNKFGTCSATDCPKLLDAVQNLKEIDDFYFIEKLGEQKNE